MDGHVFTEIVPTLVAGWLMVVAGLGKRRLDLRPRMCATCGRRRCICSRR